MHRNERIFMNSRIMLLLRPLGNMYRNTFSCLLHVVVCGMCWRSGVWCVLTQLCVVCVDTVACGMFWQSGVWYVLTQWCLVYVDAVVCVDMLVYGTCWCSGMCWHEGVLYMLTRWVLCYVERDLVIHMTQRPCCYLHLPVCKHLNQILLSLVSW